jgi:hypothetical protein
VTKAAVGGKKMTVTLAVRGGSAERTSNIDVDAGQLFALSQAATPREQLLRVTEGGNPWVVLRQDGVRCKLTSRVEPHRAVLQVALGMAVHWGNQAELPREVLATCDGVPLRCLTVAGTLDALYSAGRTSGQRSGQDACTFAAVSEQEDYLIPTNYKRLQQAVSDAASDSGNPPLGPALATLPGVAYPGPAVLGDARALCGCLQQKQWYRPGEPERVGWIMFGGEVLRHGSVISLDVDLGQGPVKLTFTVPQG